MNRFAIPIAGMLAVLAMAPGPQAPPQSAVVLNRMLSSYRSLQSFKETVTIKRKIGEKDMPGTLTIVAQKPNKYLMELKGEGLNTTVVSDGTTLVATRSDRKVFTRTKAPAQLIKTDILAGAETPSLGAKIVTALLSANIREGELGNLLVNAKVTGPQGFGSKLAYVLTFPYGDDLEAKVYVTSDDYLVRQVKLLRDGAPEMTENHDNIELDQPVAPDAFAKTSTEGFRMVSVLPPPLDPVSVASGDWGNAPDFTLEKASGGALRLSSLKGKVILLNFYFNH